MCWLVTFVTHGSRPSKRLLDRGIRTLDDRITLSPIEQIAVTADVIQNCHRIPCKLYAINVLPGHVHMVLDGSEESNLAEQVRRIKGSASTVVRRQRGIREYGPVWAQKFNRRPLRDQSSVEAAVAYVHQNHLKHIDRWGEQLLSTWETGIRPLTESLI